MVYARRDEKGKLTFQRILSDSGEEIRLRRSFDGKVGIVSANRAIYFRTDKDARMLAEEILKIIKGGEEE